MKVRLRLFHPVLLPVVLVAALAACSDPLPPDVQALKKSREALQIENGKLKSQVEQDAQRIKTLEEDLRVKTKDWADRSTTMAEESRARLEKNTELQAEVEALRAQLEPIQKAQIMDARTEATGGQIPVLKTKNGDVYKNVTIRAVVPDGIHIVHETGATKIPFSQLDPSWGTRFGYDVKEAETYSKEQARQKTAVQKAQIQALNAQINEAKNQLEKDKRSAGKKTAEAELQASRRLTDLRSLLYSELQQVNSELKGKLGSISRSEPENSPAFSNNMATLRLSRARDLRAQINDLKNSMGLY